MTKIEKIIIIGAAGFGSEVLDIFIAQNNIASRWKILGFADDNPKLKGRQINGYPVLGAVKDLPLMFDVNDIKVICAIGDSEVRAKAVKKAKKLGLKFTNAIHPTVVMTKFIKLGEGVIICAGCVLTNRISIGNYVTINLDCTIGHEVIIEDFCSFMPNCSINGRNKLDIGAYLGSGITTIPDCHIGKWSFIGAGAVVVSDIPDETLAIGVPAKSVKKLTPKLRVEMRKHLVEKSLKWKKDLYEWDEKRNRFVWQK